MIESLGENEAGVRILVSTFLKLAPLLFPARGQPCWQDAVVTYSDHLPSLSRPDSQTWLIHLSVIKVAVPPG
eukprot:2206670-Ditylum_brightwellii.AAC.1